ncbi:hypothetical protein [Reichenbachiella versicolor]|uniref:hypothetical protein n=1 Tax=Reichenbachiella versicolor TaxID=1821036 RepID=UPI000D6E0EC1|nr:hypothetical protein [Reichenbachiella versicolor]
MIKRNTLIVLVLMAMVHGGHAQITQLELASGYEKTDFTFLSISPLTQKSQFSVATLAFFQKFHLAVLSLLEGDLKNDSFSILSAVALTLKIAGLLDIS